MRIFFFIACFIFVRIVLSAQINELFTFQKDNRAIKTSWVNHSSLIKEEWKKSIPSRKKRDLNELLDNLFSQMQDQINDKSTVTDSVAFLYGKKLLSHIALSNPEIDTSNILVFFNRSAIPNAYSTGDGSIYINYGLLNILENEAQLIFILAHEIAHIQAQHVKSELIKYFETIDDKDLQAKLKSFRKLQFGANKELKTLARNLLFTARHLNRKMELEADSMAAMYLNRLTYDQNEAIKALRIIDSSEERSNLYRLDLQKLGGKISCPFKQEWINNRPGLFYLLNDTLNNDKKNLNDSLSTHPNIDLRIETLKSNIADTQEDNIAVVDSVTFKQLRNAALIEITEHYYRTDNYSLSLYYSLEMYDLQINQPYAAWSTIRTLVHVHQQLKAHSLGKYIDSESKNNHVDYNELIRFLNTIKLDELATFIECYADKILVNYEDNEQFKPILEVVSKIRK